MSDQKISINELVFKSLYYRYKAFVTPLAVIVVCFLLFWFVVLTQIQNFLATRDQIGVDQQNLDIMHKNLTLVTTFNENKLDQTLQTATNALPTEKDFSGILNALQNAAAVAGTTLGDYSFGLGDLSGLDQFGKQTAQLPVQLNVSLKTDVNGARQFVHALSTQLPLSDSLSVTVNQNVSVTVTTAFYYATLPKINFNDSSPLPILSSSDQKLLDTLGINSSFANIPLSSQSAVVQVTATPTPSLVTPTVVSSGSGR